MLKRLYTIIRPSILITSILLILCFGFVFSNILLSMDLTNERLEELRIKYKAKMEDGILKIKDRNQLYDAGKEWLTRTFENENFKIESFYIPPVQVDNKFSSLLSEGKYAEKQFFDVQFGDNGVFTKYYDKNDYLYFGFRITSKTNQKLDVDKIFKKIYLYDGLGNKVKCEKPRFMKYDKDKKIKVYENTTWEKLPGFEDENFIWVAFPKTKIEESAGIFNIVIKKFEGVKMIDFSWTLPIKMPQCRC
jgi:hypothetical protein